MFMLVLNWILEERPHFGKHGAEDHLVNMDGGSGSRPRGVGSSRIQDEIREDPILVAVLVIRQSLKARRRGGGDPAAAFSHLEKKSAFSLGLNIKYIYIFYLNIQIQEMTI